MLSQRECGNRVAALSMSEAHVRRFWLTALTLGAFFFGYYYLYFVVLPTLLRVGAG